MQLTDTEKKILVYMSSRGLDISRRPFLSIAEALGLKEEDVIDILRDLQGSGVIETLRGVIDIENAGYRENALIAWRVPDEKIAVVKDIFVGNDMISHCYERESQEGFNYNIFTMMHAQERKEIEDFASTIARDNTLDYTLLFTEEELKKEKLDLKGFL